MGSRAVRGSVKGFVWDAPIESGWDLITVEHPFKE